jgi:hypothetical protein
MFRRTLRLLCEGKPLEKTTAPIKEKHHKILDYYTPNDHLVDRLNQVPYELRGEYLPRQKQNPYKKKPLNVVYDIKDFQSYVLPSRREKVFNNWGLEELFGVKRWRNDSPFMKEYIKVDNQVFLIIVLSLFLLYPVFWAKQRKLEKGFEEYITSGYGKFTADDLI